jgi:cell division protein FtsW (lipid II flippase)
VAEIVILFAFLLLIVGVVAFGEFLNDKYQWIETIEEDNFEYKTK